MIEWLEIVVDPDVVDSGFVCVAIERELDLGEEIALVSVQTKEMGGIRAVVPSLPGRRDDGMPEALITRRCSGCSSTMQQRNGPLDLCLGVLPGDRH